jgi:co-chaperonin GroES (HSP10)|uniref:Co-chaperonin GroES n=1 Tax=uncultured virus TaxID=340016 RepID=A0A221S3B9_9VIRU|nr:co-chaperonin GroES [uncultured virus]
MPFMIMEHDKDPKQKLLDEIGDISAFDIFNNQILVAVYIRPNKTKSGIYLSDQSREEDKVQGKVGLVVKKGPAAFVDETSEWFKDISVEVNDWVVFRPSDGWSITVNNVLCRIIDDTAVRGKVDVPDRVW